MTQEDQALDATSGKTDTSALRAILDYLLPYKQQVTYALLALMFTAAVTLFIGQGVRLLIDQGIATQSSEYLRRSVLIFFGLIVALALGTFTRFYWVTWLGERVVADIRRKVFAHLIELHPGFFETNRGLEVQSRLTADTTILQSVIGSSISVALRNAIMLAGGIIWLFITNVKLSSIVVLSVPLVVAPILIFGRRVRGLSRKSQDEVANVGTYIGEMLSQIKTVQAYNHQEIDKRRFDSFVEKTFRVAKQRIIQRSLLITIVIVLVLGAVGMMLWVGGVDVIEGRMSGGELAAFIFYSFIVGSAVGSISEVISELQRAAGATERILELLNAKSEIQPPHAPRKLPIITLGNIEINHIDFRYPSRRETLAINNFSLTIRAGETLALVGPSGAGKSTLFDLLMRFADTNNGSIKLEGIKIQDLAPKTLRQQFAFVSQQPALFFGTIRDNLAYSNEHASDEKIREAAKAAHALTFIEELPKGFDTHLGDAGSGLSGGQKQRLAIARAILADAPILLLDEATSALDAQSEYLVQQALEELMQHKTTLVIAHRLATVKNADRIAVMDAGRLVAIGNHQELMASSVLYAQLANLQFNIEDAG